MAFIDEYNHEESQVAYIPESLPTQETEDAFLEITLGCNCTKKCVENRCSCLRTKRNYKSHSCKDNEESLKTYTVHKTDMPIYECNQHCKCSRFCGNRLVQYGPRDNLKIIKCEEVKAEGGENTTLTACKGFGLVTTKSIKQGQFVCEYAGEIISETEADVRFNLQEANNLMNYIICVNEQFGEHRIKTIVDPSQIGNIGRYINHSCQPNCEILPVRVNNIIPKLCLFTKEHVSANQELTFDYGDGKLGFSKTKDDVKNKKPCLCNVINCRKFLPFCKQP